MKYRYLGLCVALSILSVACVPASRRLHNARISFQHHDYHRTFLQLRPLAQAGLANAQYALGYLYFYGLGVVENHDLAREWFRAAAKQGQTQAQQALRLLQ